MNINDGTSVVINLAARYIAAFGMVQASKYINDVVITNEENKYKIDYFDDFNPETETIRIAHSSMELVFGNTLLEAGNSVFAPPLMMTFTKEKALIETETNGDDNVIIERWTTKPWEIEIKGILIDLENRQYPSDKIRELHQLFKINDILDAYGIQFEEKDIEAIYLKSLSITPTEGFADTVQFSLSASAIKSVSWTLDQPNES